MAVAIGCGHPQLRPPESSAVPWTRITGKLAFALNRSSFNAVEGFDYYGPSELFVLDGSERSVRTLKRFEASDRTSVYGLTWTPDGRVLLYVTTHGTATRRRAVAVDGTEVPLNETLSNPDNEHLIWVRDGRLAYCRERTIWVDGVPVCSLRAYANCRDQAFGWSPDGLRLVTQDQQSFTLVLTEIAVADGSRRVLRRFPNANARAKPAYSPDGSRIVVSVEYGNGPVPRGIWTVDAAGAWAQQLTAGDWDVEPTWSPDGSQIAFSRPRRSGSLEGIMLIAADGTGLVKLGDGTSPAWAP